MNPSVKRSKSRNGCRGAWKCTPVPLLLSPRGPSLDPWHPFFPSPWQAQGRAENLEFKLSLERRIGFCFSKERAKRNWGFPEPFSRAVMPSQHSPFGLWMLVYWLVEGQSHPHFPTVPYEADMRPLTLPSPSSLGRQKSWADVLKPSFAAFMQPLACPGRSHSDTRGCCGTSSFPKVSFRQRFQAPGQPSFECQTTTSNRHKVGSDPGNGNVVFLLTSSCH